MPTLEQIEAYINSLTEDELVALMNKIETDMRPFVRAYIKVVGVSTQMYNPIYMIRLRNQIVKPGMQQEDIERAIFYYMKSQQRGGDDKPTKH